jgi:MATE family multidrug resistance protein
LLAVLLFTRPILLALGQEPDLAAGAAHFITGILWGLPFALAFQVLRSFSTALSRATPPLVVMAIAILWNAAFDYALIFGHFGFPELGLFGAGLPAPAPIFSASPRCWRSVWACRPLKRYRILHRFAQPKWKSFAELFRLGLPIGITMVFEVALFNGAALVMGTFGLAALAAHQIAITIPSLTFMIPLGIGLAATVRVGPGGGRG